ncbi:hypothetical protein GCM10010524_27910 [Streptomyces mexicanus]
MPCHQTASGGGCVDDSGGRGGGAAGGTGFSSRRPAGSPRAVGAPDVTAVGGEAVEVLCDPGGDAGQALLRLTRFAFGSIADTRPGGSGRRGWAGGERSGRCASK